MISQDRWKSVQSVLLVLVAYFGGLSSCGAQSLWNNVQSEWNEVQQGNTDWYLPLHIWHNRSTYTDQQITNFNENPFGIGYGKSIQDDPHHWRAFYAMEFQDSHHKVEPIAGYAYTWNISPGDGWNLGIGYTALVTLRQDVDNYRTPVPGILPLLSAGTLKFSVFITYMPRLPDRHGDVAFFFSKISFQ